MAKNAFQTLNKYKHMVKGAVLEVGSDRFEGSTSFFSDICKTINVPFYSVDVEPGANERARAVVGDKAYLMTGEDFMRKVAPTLDTKFSFVFLDNFDFLIKSFKWEWKDHTEAVYNSLGMALNNENSQKAHLEQAQLVQPYLTPDVIIGFDDTWQKPDGTFDGKGGTAIPWLLENGYFIIEQGRIGEDIVGGYVMLTRVDVPLKIRVMACCKNEEAMLPFFLQYYEKFVDEIVIFEGGSTDRSLEIIAKCPKARVVSTGNNEVLDERELMKIRNSAYLESADQWDWQIIVDIDEFLYHPVLIQKLKEYKIRGITVPKIAGYEMLSRYFPMYKEDQTIIDQIKTGRRNDTWQAKKAIFNPKQIQVQYEFGCHSAHLSGNAIEGDTQEIMLLHYRWMSYEYFVDKNKYIANRLSAFNKANNMGYHTIEHAKMPESEFEAKVNEAYNIFDLRLNISIGVKLPSYVFIENARSLPYVDNSVTEIISFNVLEHFDFHEAWGILKEWQRVLVDGGKLRIETIDLLSLCQSFCSGDENQRVGLYESFFATPWVPERGNKFLYTENQLMWTLTSLGFRNVIRKQQSQTNKQNILRMECVK
jgi:glycosyltransferase involved in cell wall biosynthesis